MRPVREIGPRLAQVYFCAPEALEDALFGGAAVAASCHRAGFAADLAPGFLRLQGYRAVCAEFLRVPSVDLADLLAQRPGQISLSNRVASPPVPQLLRLL